MVQDATLSVGAYARRDGSQFGPQVTLTLREGSREITRWRAQTSDWAGTLTGEGPIGKARRGSWLVGLRKSYTEWPLRRSDHEASVFGVADLQSKLVYDVRPSQQFSASLVAGVSNVERDDPTMSVLGDGVNRAALVTVGLRSLVARTVIRQRASLQFHSFQNRDQYYVMVNGGAEQAAAYRLDLSQAFGRHALDAGVQLRRAHGAATWWERAGYASFRWNPLNDFSLVSGVRVAGSTLLDQQAVDRWIQAEWSAPRPWRFYGSAGVAHQFAALEQMARAW